MRWGPQQPRRERGPAVAARAQLSALSPGAAQPRCTALSSAAVLPPLPSLPSLEAPPQLAAPGGCRHGSRRAAAAAGAAFAAGGGRGRPGGAQPAGELAAPQRERLGVAPSGGAGLRSHRAALPGPHPGTVPREPGPGAALPAVGSPPPRGEPSPPKHSPLPAAARPLQACLASPGQQPGFLWWLQCAQSRIRPRIQMEALQYVRLWF